VVVSGSITPRVNGYYAPLSQESDDWPIYSKLGDREMLLRYVKPECKSCNLTYFLDT
jgi:hypothetical protein